MHLRVDMRTNGRYNLTRTVVRFFVEVLTAGFVEMFRKYLLGGTELTSEEIVQQTNRIFCSGVAAYR